MAEGGEKMDRMAKEMFGDSDSEEEEGPLDPGTSSRTMPNNSAVESKDWAVEGRESKLPKMLGESASKAEEKGLAVSSGSVSSVPTPTTTTSTSTHKLPAIEEKGEENTERDADSKRKLQELFGESSSSEDNDSGSEEDDAGGRQKRGSKATNIKHGTGAKRLRKKGGNSSLRKNIPKKRRSGRVDEDIAPRNRDDDDFIDNEDDDKELLAEYDRDAPPPGSDSEAEEDNNTKEDQTSSKGTAMMDEILKSMRPCKAEVLSHDARESLSQDLLQMMDAAAMDDELALEEGRQALNKIKLLSLVQRALSKQDLIEALLEFDLLAVLKRWIQPYRNGALPSVTVRSAIYSFLLTIPAQLDHLKRSGIGVAILNLVNHPDETVRHKKVLKQIIDKWNRPIFQREMDYKVIGQISMLGEGGETSFEQQDIPRRVKQQSSKNVEESVQDVLGQRQQKSSTPGKGKDGAFSSQDRARIPVSCGFSFQKAPKSRFNITAVSQTSGVDIGPRVGMGSKAALSKKMRAKR